MGEFDSAIEMGKAVEAIEGMTPEQINAEIDKQAAGDEAEGAETPPAETPAPEADPPTPDPENVPDVTVEESHEPDPTPGVDLDKLLGIGKPKSEEPPKQEDAQESKEPEGEQPEHKVPAPGSVEERLADLSATVKFLKEDRDRLIDQSLNQGQPNQAEGEAKPEIDPEVLEYFKPIVQEVFGKQIDELTDAVKPIQEQNADANLSGLIGQHVKGFKPEHMRALYDATKEMPDENKSLYTGSVAGAILLAKELKSRGALKGLKTEQKPNSSILAARHHAEITGPTPRDVDDMSDEEKARRLADMDGDKILDILDQMEM